MLTWPEAGSSIVLGEATLAEFQSALRGELIRPGDAEYSTARRVWNGLIDRHPALVARCASADDVAEAVRFARSHQLALAVRGGGHNVAGFGTCDDALVIDLSPMRRVEVDPAARLARAQGGATWGDVDRATQAHGLGTTGGLVSTTGIGGFTTGGGIGWLMRRYGLALDNLESVQIVLADGRCVRADSAENSDLFWGVRGGGGNFGVVTEFTYRLHRVGPTIFGGALFHPLVRARELLRFYREWAPSLPDELTTMVAFLIAPPAPFVPPALQGTPMVAVALCACGPLEQGAEQVGPLRDLAPALIDLLGPMPYTALQTLFDATAPYGLLSYWKTEYLPGLDDGALEALIEAADRMRSPLSAIHVQQAGGAVGRVPPGSTAFAHRDRPYILNVIGGWTDPADTEANIAWVRAGAEAVRPYATGETYLNFLDATDPARIRAAYGASYERLVQIKNTYDPANVFRLNHNLRPTVQ
jgi:FAD/FMN-containing dehydrogenase